MMDQSQAGPVVVEQSLNDFVDKANEAINKMSVGNPHRRVLWELGNALVALGDCYANLESKYERNLRELEQLTLAVNKMKELEEQHNVQNASASPIVVP